MDWFKTGKGVRQGCILPPCLFDFLVAQLVKNLPAMQVDPSLIPGSGRFLQFAVICTVKSFSVVNEAEVDVFLEFPWFSYDSADVANLISGCSAFSKSSL